MSKDFDSKFSINFTLCSEQLPNKSGDYVCNVDNGMIWTLPYSDVHKEFNVLDWQDEPKSAVKVKAWAELPEWTKDILER